jgi:hypothetical protein
MVATSNMRSNLQKGIDAAMRIDLHRIEMVRCLSLKTPDHRLRLEEIFRTVDSRARHEAKSIQRLLISLKKFILRMHPASASLEGIIADTARFKSSRAHSGAVSPRPQPHPESISYKTPHAPPTPDFATALKI